MERNPLIVVGALSDALALGESSRTDESARIIQRARSAKRAGVGCVIVDGEDGALSDAAEADGAYVFRPGADPDDHRRNYQTPSRAERVAYSVNKFDRFYNHDIIINVHQSLGAVSPNVVRALLYPLADMTVDMATVAAPIAPDCAGDETFVKAEIEWFERRRVHVLTGIQIGRAVNFSRRADQIKGPPFFVHIPIYSYKRASLDRFVNLEPSRRELEEQIEPLRALDNNLRLGVVMIDETPDESGHS